MFRETLLGDLWSCDVEDDAEELDGPCGLDREGVGCPARSVDDELFRCGGVMVEDPYTELADG